MKQLSNMIKILIFFKLFQSFLSIPNDIFLSYENLVPNINNETNTTFKEPEYFIISYLAYIIKSFLPQQNPDALYSILNGTKCFKKYTENYNRTSNLSDIIKTIKYSGKTYPDYGDEQSCIEANNSFILFTINFTVINSTHYNGTFKLLPFINSGYSFYGLCIKNDYNCPDELPNSVKEEFEKISSYNNSKVGYNVTYHRNPDPLPEDKYERKIIGNICLILLGVYIILRLIIAIIGDKCFKSDEKKNKKDDDSNSSSSSSSSSGSDDGNLENSKSDQNQKKDIVVLTQTMSKSIVKSGNLNKIKHEKLYLIYKIFSLGVGVDNIVKNKGKIYNESDLYLIYFLRGISLILKTFNIDISSIVYIPSREINVSFFKSFVMFFVKMSSFADVLFILCEGIILGYKLMSFIRKYNKNNDCPSFKLFTNFFMRFIPSFSTIFSVFIFLYYLSDYYLYIILGMNDEKKTNYYQTKMQHFRKITYCRDCMKNTTEIFEELIPFHMQRIYKNENLIDEFKCCFQFIVVFINFFYCFLILLLLTFISFKLKKKLYDYIILVLLIINLAVPNNINNKVSLVNGELTGYFNIKMLFGEYCSLKFTYLFLNYYTLGFFVGLAIFYNNDLTQDNSMDKSSLYKPFSFCAKFIRFFYLKSFLLNIFLTFIISLMIIALFLTFWIFVNIESNNMMVFDIEWYHNFFYKNEKSIFAICVGFFIILIYTFKKDVSSNVFFNNRVFTMFNRIGYGYYAVIELVIYLLYCLGEFEVQLNALNYFYINCGLIFVLSIIGVQVVIVFEIPCRIICKELLKLKSVDEEEEDNIDSI